MDSRKFAERNAIPLLSLTGTLLHVRIAKALNILTLNLKLAQHVLQIAKAVYKIPQVKLNANHASPHSFWSIKHAERFATRQLNMIGKLVPALFATMECG